MKILQSLQQLSYKQLYITIWFIWSLWGCLTKTKVGFVCIEWEQYTIRYHMTSFSLKNRKSLYMTSLHKSLTTFHSLAIPFDSKPFKQSFFVNYHHTYAQRDAIYIIELRPRFYIYSFWSSRSLIVYSQFDDVLVYVKVKLHLLLPIALLTS